MSQTRAERTYVVGPVEEVPPGTVRIVPVGKFGVGVFNVAGRFYALTNYCPHRGAPLCLGTVTGTALPGKRPYSIRWEREGEILRCPWHSWEYEIASGRALAHPEKGIRTYPVTVRDGQIVIGPI